MDILKLFFEIANFTGWFLIALVLLVALFWGKFIYDQRIIKLKEEIENGKAYRYDDIYKRLTERTKILSDDLRSALSEADVKQEKIDRIKKDLDLSNLEIHDLQTKLRNYDEQLDELLEKEPDFCNVCGVDDEHVMMNTIMWGNRSEKLVGDPLLVDKEGVCLYCNAPNLKCKICGNITGIDVNSIKPEVECTGGCGTIYEQVAFFGDRSERLISVTRKTQK